MLSDRAYAQKLAELTAGEQLALYRLAVQLRVIAGRDGVPVDVWQRYARIALWLPPAPAPAPRPRVG